jgi:TolA-binding protein
MNTLGTRQMFRAAFCVAALAAAADSMAQFGGGRSRGGGGSRERPQQQEQQRPAPNPETGINMLEQTIEELRIDLKLLPAQVPVWEAYVSKARLLASDIARERSMTTASTQTSVLKRIDQSVDAARNRLAALEEVSDAAKAFYAVLTPGQQLVADPRLAALVPGRAGTYQSAPPKGTPPPRPVGTGY